MTLPSLLDELEQKAELYKKNPGRLDYPTAAYCLWVDACSPETVLRLVKIARAAIELAGANGAYNTKDGTWELPLDSMGKLMKAVEEP